MRSSRGRQPCCWGGRGQLGSTGARYKEWGQLNCCGVEAAGGGSEQATASELQRWCTVVRSSPRRQAGVADGKEGLAGVRTCSARLHRPSAGGRAACAAEDTVAAACSRGQGREKGRASLCMLTVAKPHGSGGGAAAGWAGQGWMGSSVRALAWAEPQLAQGWQRQRRQPLPDGSRRQAGCTARCCNSSGGGGRAAAGWAQDRVGLGGQQRAGTGSRAAACCGWAASAASAAASQTPGRIHLLWRPPAPAGWARRASVCVCV